VERRPRVVFGTGIGFSIGFVVESGTWAGRLKPAKIVLSL
jgi:hypothetical protein